MAGVQTWRHEQARHIYTSSDTTSDSGTHVFVLDAACQAASVSGMSPTTSLNSTELFAFDTRDGDEPRAAAGQFVHLSHGNALAKRSSLPMRRLAWLQAISGRRRVGKTDLTCHPAQARSGPMVRFVQTLKISSRRQWPSVKYSISTICHVWIPYSIAPV